MTQKQEIKDLLSDGNWHHMTELNAICYRYSARLYELSEEGYEWEKKQLKKGEFTYRRKPLVSQETNESFIKWVELQRKIKEESEKQNSLQEALF